jgi:enoyl-CoA hydratase
MTEEKATESAAVESEIVLSEPSPGVRLITMNRPSKLNALSESMVHELYAALDEIADDRTCRVVILTGAGRGFCSGLDLTGYGIVPGHEEQGPVQRTFATQQQIAGLIPRMRRLPQPIIAAVNGPASGGGLALVLGSDIRLSARSAVFNAAFVRIGLSGADIGTSWSLPRIVGAGRAHELMLTGRIFDADEAFRIGLVLEVVDDSQLLDRALEEAEMIICNSPFSVHMTKEVMWSALEIPGQQAAIDLENRTQVMVAQTHDHVEAKEAFVQRRPPQFRDN